MKTVIAILAVFLFIMGYRIYVILRDGPPSRTKPKRASDDENVNKTIQISIILDC